MPNPSDSSLDDLLSFIASYTVKHFKATGRRTDGAVLADAIRTQFPGLSYEQLGLTRLSDAVREAEHRGLITRHRDVKHLEISPGPQSGLELGAEVTTLKSANLPHIRPEVWRAFVFVSPGNFSFINRNSGRLVSLSDDSQQSGSLEADDEWVRVSPIPASTQQSWMVEFLQTKPSLNAEEAPIQVRDWWVQFPVWLRSVESGLDREWNRHRTSKVLEHLQTWAREHNLAVELLVSATQPLRESRKKPPSDTKSAGLRHAILAAIAEMPDDQLEDIAIPIKYVIRHFKPR